MELSKTQTTGLGLVITCAVVVILLTGAFVSADDQPDPSLRAGAKGEQSIMAGSATDAQLEKLVAPVALYPDSLLKAVLDACTHPSDVVAAGDFLKAKQGTVTPNPQWPTSIEALLHYPDVLMNMDGNLGWATRLGNAWSQQQKTVEEAVNYVRQKAQQAGNLKSNDKQTVADNDGNVTITSPDPSVVYVPQYDPAYLYVPGAFYGGYGYAGAPVLHFATGMAVGAAIANHNYVHGAYPHYAWAHPAGAYRTHPGAAYGAGVEHGRAQGFAAGTAAANRGGAGDTHVHYHVHNNYNGFGGAGHGGFGGAGVGGFGGAGRGGLGGADRGGDNRGGFGGGGLGGENRSGFGGGGFGGANRGGFGGGGRFGGGAGFGGFHGGGRRR